MNARDAAPDPYRDRLSEFLDDELSPAERSELEAHLATCAECRALLADLRRIASAARALPARAPERDLWPDLVPRLGLRATPTRRRALLLAAFAAGVLATLIGVALFGHRRVAEPQLASAERYLLLLHEPADFELGQDPAQHRTVVERYERWATELGARCLGGEELDPRALELREAATPVDVPAGPRVGGFFLLAADDEAQALALARTCPHLERGGWIELRRVR